MGNRKLTLLACGALGVALGLGLYTFWYAEGLSYMSNDPKACVNCHVMRPQYEGWLKGSHHEVATCNDCHTPHALVPKYLTKLDNGWNHSKKFTLQSYELPIRIRPANLDKLQKNCIECHGVMVSEIAAHQDLPVKEARCTDCHRSVGHMSLE